jgi:hypothetical protein
MGCRGLKVMRCPKVRDGGTKLWTDVVGGVRNHRWQCVSLAERRYLKEMKMSQETTEVSGNDSRVISTEPLQHWASDKYVGSCAGMVVTHGQLFTMEVDDRRKGSGQMFVTTAAEGGQVDDMLSVCMEVSSLPGKSVDLAVAHVHFGGDDVAFSAFKVGDEIVLRLENGVTMREERLEDGTQVFVLR